MVKKFIGSAALTPSGVPDDLLTTKGDTHGFSSTNARIPIGSDDTVLTADSGETLGLKWAASGGGGTAFFGFNRGDYTNTNSQYFSLFATSSSVSTESDVSIPCNTDLTCTRYQINIQANGKGSDQVTAFRDDGANVAPVTITASTTGTFDSGAVSVSIALGSLINFAIHNTVSGTVTTYSSICECST